MQRGRLEAVAEAVVVEVGAEERVAEVEADAAVVTKAEAVAETVAEVDIEAAGDGVARNMHESWKRVGTAGGAHASH